MIRTLDRYGKEGIGVAGGAVGDTWFESNPTPRYVIDPVLVDAAMHIIARGTSNSRTGRPHPLPIGVQSLEFFSPPPPVGNFLLPPRTQRESRARSAARPRSLPSRWQTVVPAHERDTGGSTAVRSRELLRAEGRVFPQSRLARAVEPRPSGTPRALLLPRTAARHASARAARRARASPCRVANWTSTSPGPGPKRG